MTTEFDIKRTIDEVLDLETGETVYAVDFFKQPEAVIFSYRERQQLAIDGSLMPKFVCLYCRQTVKILGRENQKGVVSFFSHLYDSDDCDIKTNGKYNKEEIEALKFAGTRESLRHINLKEKIFKALVDEKSKSQGIQNVQIEKHFKSENPLLNWRRPDIYAELGEKKIVFELQLSTTFLSVIIARDIFYRLNNTFIIWIFNFSENSQYVDLQNMMCKDIYYANKRNAFVFDEDAAKKSKEEKELVLLCIWFEPKIEEGKIVSRSMHQQYVKLSELTFDESDNKPYFIDADELFYRYDQEQANARKTLEADKLQWINQIEQNLIRKAEAKQLEKQEKEFLLKSNIERIKSEVLIGKITPSPIKKNGKWGYEAEGELIILPQYNQAEPFVGNLARVKSNRRFGFINKQGNEVIPCVYLETYEFKNGTCLVRDPSGWLTINDSNVELMRHRFDKLELYDSGLSILQFTVKETYKRFGGRNYHGLRYYVADHYEKFGLISSNGIVLARPIYSEINELSDSTATATIREITYKMDKPYGLEHAVFKDYVGTLTFQDGKIEGFLYSEEELPNGNTKGFKNGFCGIRDASGSEVLPYCFDYIGPFIDHKAKAQKDGLWGYIDMHGREVVPLIYSSFSEFKKGRAKVQRQGLWGYINENGMEVIPCIFNEIEAFVNGKAKAQKMGYWGYINELGDEVIACKFKSIGPFILGTSKVEKHGLLGYLDEAGNEVIPCIYERIESFIDGKAKVKKAGCWGYIDHTGKEVIPCCYDSIDTFQSGKAKVSKDNLWCYIDSEGNTIVPLIYQDLIDMKNGFYKIQQQNKWGYCDLLGNVVVNPIYDELGVFFTGSTTIKSKKESSKIRGLARYKLGEKRGYVDSKGKEYWQYWRDERDFSHNKAYRSNNKSYR